LEGQSVYHRRMQIDAPVPIIWKLSLASPPARVWLLLDTDAGRERHWALTSEATEAGFRLSFPGDQADEVKVLERDPPRRMRIDYFGVECELMLEPTPEGGTLLTAIDHADDAEEWLGRHPGWVSWLLILKGAADFGVDLRNHHPERHWLEGFVDP
jgi:hypothetical protein